MGYLRNKIDNLKKLFYADNEDNKQQKFEFTRNEKSSIKESVEYDDTLVYNGLKNTSAPGLTARKKVSDKYLLEFEFLKRINGLKYDNISNEFHYWEEDFVERTISRLKKNGTIELILRANPLDSYKMADLKQFLQDNDLESKGNKKAVLIERIKENLSEEEINNWNPPQRAYVLTERGKARYHELLIYKENLYNNTFDSMMKYAEKRDFQNVYRCICKYKIKQVLDGGLHYSTSVVSNSYWEEELIKGLTGQREFIYIQFTNYINDSLLAAFAIVFNLFGGGYKGMQNKIERYLKAYQIDREITESDVIHATTIYCSVRNLIEYRRANIDKYQISSPCDTRTCKKCAHLDGKVFKVSNAQIGVSMPPFCDNCRCTTVSVIEFVDESDQAERLRRVRDENGKSIVVPYMTYKEWSKKYAPEKYKEYFKAL